MKRHLAPVPERVWMKEDVCSWYEGEGRRGERGGRSFFSHKALEAVLDCPRGRIHPTACVWGDSLFDAISIIHYHFAVV